MSRHRCNCCDSPTSCPETGPCCTAPGRCTPRGYVQGANGAWTGTPPAAMHGRVMVSGTVELRKQRSKFGTAAVERSHVFNVAMTGPGPSHDGGEFEMTPSGAGDCRGYHGEMDYGVHTDEELYDLTCSTNLDVLRPVDYRVQGSFDFAPTGDLPGFWGSGRNLMRATITIKVYTATIELKVWAWRPDAPGLSVAAPALARVYATLRPDAFSPAIAVDVAPQVETPCGTRLNIAVIKPIEQAPFAVNADGCPLLGEVNSNSCRICTSMGVALVVNIDLGDDFQGCQQCTTVGYPISTICGHECLTNFLPPHSKPVLSNGCATWRWLPMRGTWKVRGELTLRYAPGLAPYEVRTYTGDGDGEMVAWSNGAPQGDVFCPCGGALYVGARGLWTWTLADIRGVVIESHHGQLDLQYKNCGLEGHLVMVPQWPGFNPMPPLDQFKGVDVVHCGVGLMDGPCNVGVGDGVTPGFELDCQNGSAKGFSLRTNSVAADGSTYVLNIDVAVTGFVLCQASPPPPPPPPGGGDSLLLMGGSSGTGGGSGGCGGCTGGGL